MNGERKIKKFGEWLDGAVIGDCVLDVLEEIGENTTVESMKQAWLNNLEHIIEDIKASIECHIR